MPSTSERDLGSLGEASAVLAQFRLAGSPPRGPVDSVRASGDDGEMEARVARLEASLSHIERDIGEIKTDIREGRRDARSDFRLLFGAIIAVALGLAGLMARGFGWL
jgi:hypothetical protein